MITEIAVVILLTIPWLNPNQVEYGNHLTINLAIVQINIKQFSPFPRIVSIITAFIFWFFVRIFETSQVCLFLLLQLQVDESKHQIPYLWRVTFNAKYTWMFNNHLKIKIPKMGLWILTIFQPLPSALTVFSISLLENFILPVAQANTCELSLISLFTLYPNQEIWSMLWSKYIENSITPHFLTYPPNSL